MDNQKAKEEIVQAGIRMLNAGLTVGTWGNISIYDRENNRVYLTPSGMPYNTLTVDDIPVLDIDGNVVEGTRKPTIEKDLHLGIYSAYSDVNAVLHTHPKWSMIFATIGKSIPLICDEAAQFFKGEVRCTKYALPGSKEIADECVKALFQSNACLLSSHGSVITASNLNEAFGIATVLEYTAELYYKVLSMGEKPQVISEENIKYMYEFVHTKYGQK